MLKNTVEPNLLHSLRGGKTVTLFSADVFVRYEADANKVLNMDRMANQLTDAAGKESGEAQNALQQLSDLEKKLPKPLTVVDLNGLNVIGSLCSGPLLPSLKICNS